MKAANDIFASHDFIMEPGDCHCPDCLWYGDSKNECEENDQGELECPECTHVVEFYPITGREIDSEDLEIFTAELITQAIKFNRKHGHKDYNRGGNLYNIMVELDMHGGLDVRILDWDAFRMDNSRQVEYYTYQEELKVNNPADFDVAKARDLLFAIEALILRMDK